MTRIKVIGYEESDGRLKEIYDDIIKSRGKLADVHKIQSLLPETITKHLDLYKELMFGKSNIKREIREMIAVVVSLANNCKYCILHHSEALNFYWKDQNRIDAFVENYRTMNFDTKTFALLDYANDLTINPSSINDSTIENLRKYGYSDEDILISTLIISYFNFVNRIVMSMGLEINNDEVSGYKY